MVVCKKAYHKKYYAKNGEQFLARQFVIVPRTPRFSNHVVKGGMKTTGRGSPAAKEPIVNKTKNTSEIINDNTVKSTGNGSTNIGDLIMPRIRKTSSRDFVTKNKEK